MALSSIMTGALLSANTSRKIAHVQHATKKQMDGHAGVLEAEIKLDSASGGDVTKKKIEKAKVSASESGEVSDEAATVSTEDTVLDGASIDIVSSDITVSTGSVSEPAGKNVDVKV